MSLFMAFHSKNSHRLQPKTVFDGGLIYLFRTLYSKNTPKPEYMSLSTNISFRNCTSKNTKYKV